MQGYLSTGGAAGEAIRADHLAPGIAARILRASDFAGDRKHMVRKLRHVPARLHSAIVAAYGREYAARGQVAANLGILATAETFSGRGLDLAASDREICELAKVRAGEVRDMLARRVQSTAEAVRADLESWAAARGVAAPAGLHMTLRGMIGRMVAPAWWRRALRRAIVREVEAQAINLGMVRRQTSPYASIEAIARRGEQSRRNRRMLENTEAVREDGQAVALDILAAGSVSNPMIRRIELMTRIAGFERCAQAAGHAAMFYTFTCPSRYHARLSASGAVNPKWEAGGRLTPKQGQEYLSKVWARARAALARIGVAVYGFRVAEPHHDGTPHWHALFFMAADAVHAVTEILKRYFCKEDAAELNNVAALDARFKAIVIDRAKGSAAGYIAKYIAKNIDGKAIGEDEDFETGARVWDSISNVDAWAGTWGIRQFQQIGGAGVTIWRELRRLREGPQLELFARAWGAADAGDWQGYQDAQGGVTARRRDRPIVLWREFAERENQYGEQVAGAVSGLENWLAEVSGDARAFERTRMHDWVLRRAHGKDKIEARLCGQKMFRCVRRAAQSIDEISGDVSGVHLEQKNGMGNADFGLLGLVTITVRDERGPARVQWRNDAGAREGPAWNG